MRGIEVRDIISATSVRRHTLPDWAHVEGTTITYPGDETLGDALSRQGRRLHPAKSEKR